MSSRTILHLFLGYSMGDLPQNRLENASVRVGRYRERIPTLGVESGHLFVAEFIGDANFLEGEITEMSDVIRVSTKHGLVSSSSKQIDETLKKGERVTVCVRPEKIAIGEEHDFDNALTGIVEKVVYSGPDVRYIVRPSQDCVVNVDKLVEESRSLYRPGEKIHLGWTDENCLILPLP